MMTARDQFPTFFRVGAWILSTPKALLRFTLRTWRPVLAVFLLLATAHGIATFVLGRKVEAEIGRLKARGEPVSLVDLAGPKIPDSENGAVIYAKVFKIISSPGYKGDNEAVAGILDPEERVKHPEWWIQARTIVDSYPSIQPLAEEAVSRPKCRFPVKWEKVYDVTFEHLRYMRTLARYLCAKAVLDANSGKTGEAVRSLELALRASESLKEEPILIGTLVRAAMIRIALDALRDIEDSHDLTGIDTRGLVSVLSGIDLNSGYQTALKGERTWICAVFDDIRKHGIRYEDMGLDVAKASFWLRLRGTYLGRPLLYLDELDYMKRMGKMIEELNGPFRNSNQPIVDSPSIDISQVSSLADMLCPAYSRGWAAREKCEASIRGSQILLALVAFKSRFGAYPNVLTQLNTALGWKLSLEDPLSGKDFIYKRVGKGFLLYSIGENLKDDGGTEPKGNDRTGGDIVWRMGH
ncbi:MAG: hypothetical protein M1133_02905 [Armatimonadetes bacterium]|nr:hypothetical protein [Armatimonadota bacterium]